MLVWKKIWLGRKLNHFLINIFQFSQRLNMHHFDDWSLLIVTLICCEANIIIPIFTNEATDKSCHLTLSKVTKLVNSRAGLRGSPFP